MQILMDYKLLDMSSFQQKSIFTNGSAASKAIFGARLGSGQVLVMPLSLRGAQPPSESTYNKQTVQLTSTYFHQFPNT